MGRRLERSTPARCKTGRIDGESDEGGLEDQVDQLGNTFGQVVKALRKRDGLTLAAVAKRVGSLKGYVSGIERGKVNPPSVKIVLRFASLFKVNALDLCELAVVSKAPPIIRDRLRRRIADNPLARAEIGHVKPVPPIVIGEPWPPGKIQGAVPRLALPSERSNPERTVAR